MEMIICDRDLKECCLIEKAVYDYYGGIPILIHHCQDWEGLCTLIKEKQTDAVVIAQDGVVGLDIITGLKVPSGKLIWFSDLDFGVQAYRLGVSYFNKKPITFDKVIHALKHIETS